MLDDDVLKGVRQMSRHRGTTFEEALNGLLRLALAQTQGIHGWGYDQAPSQEHAARLGLPLGPP